MRTRKYYRRTSCMDALRILDGGFRDGTGSYLTASTWKGVWISDRPLDVNEGAEGDVLLEITIDRGLVEPLEWVEKDKPYREFLVPARLLNLKARLRVVDEKAELD